MGTLLPLRLMLIAAALLCLHGASVERNLLPALFTRNVFAAAGGFCFTVIQVALGFWNVEIKGDLKQWKDRGITVKKELLLKTMAKFLKKKKTNFSFDLDCSKSCF